MQGDFGRGPERGSQLASAGLGGTGHAGHALWPRRDSFRTWPGIGCCAVLRGHMTLAFPPSPLGGAPLRRLGGHPDFSVRMTSPSLSWDSQRSAPRPGHCQTRPTCSPRRGATAVCAPEQLPPDVRRRPRPHVGRAPRHPQTVEKKEVRLTCQCAERSWGGDRGGQRLSASSLPSPCLSPPLFPPPRPPAPQFSSLFAFSLSTSPTKTTCTAQHRVHFRVVKSFL